MSETDSLLDDVGSLGNGQAHHDDTEVLIKSGRTRKASDSDTPPDRYYFVYIVFYIFGMCSVLPWNMFITAQHYFDYKFEYKNQTPPHNYSDPTKHQHEPESELQSMYESYFSVAAQVPNVIMQLINTGIKHKITLKIRMLVSLCGMLVIFIFTTVMTRVDTDTWQKNFLYVTLASVVVINCFSAIFQGSVFGLGGLLPKRYTQSLMAGQGLGGILPALISIICIATIDEDSLVGFVYFLSAVVCIIITCAAYLVLPRNQFAEYYLHKQVLSTERGLQDMSTSISDSFEVKKTAKPPFWSIFKKMWVPGIMVFLVFAVTLGNFPGVISQIAPMKQTDWNDTYFTPVFCFLLFNALDYTGRSLSFLQWPGQDRLGILSLLVVLRIGFFPLFALCNVTTTGERNLPLVFSHDAYPIVFMIFFAFSNGYLGSLGMMYGPKLVQLEHQETAGNMMAFFLVLGLGVGSAISLGVLQII